jgi:hypothetical protein
MTVTRPITGKVLATHFQHAGLHDTMRR